MKRPRQIQLLSLLLASSVATEAQISITPESTHTTVTFDRPTVGVVSVGTKTSKASIAEPNNTYVNSEDPSESANILISTGVASRLVRDGTEKKTIFAEDANQDGDSKDSISFSSVRVYRPGEAYALKPTESTAGSSSELNSNALILSINDDHFGSEYFFRAQNNTDEVIYNWHVSVDVFAFEDNPYPMTSQVDVVFAVSNESDIEQIPFTSFARIDSSTIQASQTLAIRVAQLNETIVTTGVQPGGYFVFGFLESTAHHKNHNGATIALDNIGVKVDIPEPQMAGMLLSFLASVMLRRRYEKRR